MFIVAKRLTDQDVTWYGGRPQPKRLCVRLGPSRPPQKGGGAPKFSATAYCGQTAEWMKLVLGMEVSLSPGDFVLDGDPVPFPQFSAHLYCGQTAACIKIPLVMELGLGPGDFVLGGDPVALSPKGGDPKFSAHVYCDQTAGWIKLVLGMEVGLSPGDLVFDWDPATPRRKDKRLDVSRCHLVRR